MKKNICDGAVPRGRRARRPAHARVPPSLLFTRSCVKARRQHPQFGMQRERNQQTSRTCAAEVRNPSGPETGLSPAIAKTSLSSAGHSVRTRVCHPCCEEGDAATSSPASVMCRICKPLGCCCISAPRFGLLRNVPPALTAHIKLQTTMLLLQLAVDTT